MSRSINWRPGKLQPHGHGSCFFYLQSRRPDPHHRAREKPMARKSSSGGRKYGKKASSKVKRAMHEMKRGKLKSGRSGKTVKSRKQAIAIGLSEARRSGGKVPSPKSSSRRKR